MKEKIAKYLPLTKSNLLISAIDVEELFLIKQSFVNEKDGLMTCRPILNKSDEDYRKFYESLVEGDKAFVFAIYRLDGESNKQLIGKVTVMDYNSRNRSIELGYYTIPMYRKNRYMYVALQDIFKLLFKDVNINKVYAQTGSFNIPSVRLLEALGFHRDAILREHHELDGVLFDDYIYSLTHRDWVEEKENL